MYLHLLSMASVIAFGTDTGRQNGAGGDVVLSGQLMGHVYFTVNRIGMIIRVF